MHHRKHFIVKPGNFLLLVLKSWCSRAKATTLSTLGKSAARAAAASHVLVLKHLCSIFVGTALLPPRVFLILCQANLKTVIMSRIHLRPHEQRRTTTTLLLYVRRHRQQQPNLLSRRSTYATLATAAVVVVKSARIVRRRPPSCICRCLRPRRCVPPPRRRAGRVFDECDEMR
jgi:hypothetical protein